MRASVITKIKAMVALFLVAFVLVACGKDGNSADFVNPNKAIDAYVNGQNIVGMTVNVTATISDTGSADTACSFYSEGYNGSFKENVLVFGLGEIAIEKGETYTIKITEVRKSNNTYVIEGDFILL